MEKADLLKLLNLSPPPEPAGTLPGRLLEASQTPPEGETGPSPYSLVLDAWDKAQGALLASLEDLGLPPEAWADFHGAAFLDDPAPHPNPQDWLRTKFLGALFETPDYVVLHHSTKRDVAASRLAAKELANNYAKLRDKTKEIQGKLPAKYNPKQALQAKKDEEKALLLSVGQALKDALEEVEEYDEMVRGLGGEGADKNLGMDPDEVAKVFERVKNDPDLRDIFQRAGRFRRAAQTAQFTKMIHGYDDMIGITVDDDPAKLLSSELAQLDDPDLGDEALLRIMEKRAMAREYVAYESEEQGPVVFVVDESGSMHGVPVREAKAFALALVWKARHTNRWICLVGYAGGSKGHWLVIPPGKRDDMKLLDWLKHFYGKGSQLDVPLHELPFTYWPDFIKQGLKRGKTDVILCTDAIVYAPKSLTEPFNQWKKEEKVRCIGLVLNEDAGDLKWVCDEIHLMKSVALEEEGVQACLNL